MGWLIVAVIVVLIIGFVTVRRGKIRVPSGNDPKFYKIRTNKRLDRLEQINARVGHLIERGGMTPQLLKSFGDEVRTMANDQLREVVPHEALRDSNDVYYQMINLSSRKYEDLLATGGTNLNAIAAEENQLAENVQARAIAAERDLKTLSDSLGMPMPDLSDEGLKKR